uniref:AD domain-containing protein n=1 Tax=Arion vulgaris TaxID=1028688 RepID=A0A0B6Z839_9EUPU
MDHVIQELKGIEEIDSVKLHPIFTKDPADWMKLVNHQIQVTTENGQVHVGHVYTVDPVSESIVLISPVGTSFETSSNIALKLLVGASVTDVKIISEGTEIVKRSFNQLFRPAIDETLSDEALNARKLKLKAWFEKNRLPVTLGGDSQQYLTVAGVITVQPPYTEDSCLSTNEIILSRIQALINNMPDDVSG